TTKYDFRYSKKDGVTTLALPYKGGDLQFLILLPEKMDGLGALESKVTPQILAQSAQLPKKEVVVYMPRFKLESSTMSLSKHLQSLGMRTAFDVPPGSANFDRMAPRKPDEYLAISEVFHKTFVEVDEKGTEAAASTAVGMVAL